MPAKIDVGGGSYTSPAQTSPQPRPTPSPTPSPTTTGSYYESRLNGGGDSGSGTAQGSAGTVERQPYKSPVGVPYPMGGQYGGVYGSQRWFAGAYPGMDGSTRLGFNPDALEAFPNGVYFRTASAGTASWSDLTPAYRAWIDDLAKNPNIGSSTSTGRMLWERTNTLAADKWANEGVATSPQQLLAELAAGVGISPDLGDDSAARAAGGSGGGSYGGYRSYGGGGYSGGGGSGGSSRVDLTNPTTARGLLMQTMQQVLGRNPTDKEVREFTKTLSREETANPTTVVADATGVVQSGGTDPSMIALDYAKARDDFKSRQAGKYFNVFMSALGGGYSG